MNRLGSCRGPTRPAVPPFLHEEITPCLTLCRPPVRRRRPSEPPHTRGRWISLTPSPSGLYHTSNTPSKRIRHCRQAGRERIRDLTSVPKRSALSSPPPRTSAAVSNILSDDHGRRRRRAIRTGGDSGKTLRKLRPVKEQFTRSATTRSAAAGRAVSWNKVTCHQSTRTRTALSEGRTPILWSTSGTCLLPCITRTVAADYINAFYNVLNGTEVAPPLRVAK